MQIVLAIFFVVFVVFLASMFWMLPEWSRPSIYFAVTVPAGFRTSVEGRQILQRYRLQAISHVAIGCGLVLGGLAPDRWALLVIGWVWLAFGPLVAFLLARSRVMPHSIKPSMVREAVLAPRAAHLPGGWLLQLGPFAILAATAIYLRLHWDQIPDRFPVHWGMDGRPNGWSERTALGVYGPLILGVSVLAGLSVMTYTILREARVIRAPESGAVHHDFAHQVGYFLSGVEFFLAAAMSAAALLPLTGNPGFVVVFIPILVLLAAIFPLAHWLNKSRVPFASESAHGPLGDGTLDERWKLGMFYFNPDDPALFVEKRFGIGYTLNLARGLSWVVLLLVLLLPLTLLFTVLRHP